MSADVARLVLVTGPEDLLGDRAVDKAVAARRALAPDAEVVRIDANGYEPGTLAVHTSPSLFGEDRVIVVSGLEEASDELLAELRELVGAVPDDVWLVLRHRSGQRGKAVLDAVRKAAAEVVECPAVKSEKDKLEFVRREVGRLRRKLGPGADVALVEALGSDLRELASACSQLVADTESGVVIDTDLVETYYGGRVEATGFKVADAAVSGQTAQALALLRHALATGVDPVPIVAVLASSLRTLAKVAGAGGSRNAARDLGLAPWQVDKARRQLRGWKPDALADAITAVAAADDVLKGGGPVGGGRDPIFTIERAVLTVAEAASRR